MYLNILKTILELSGVLFVILFSVRAFCKFDDLGKLSPFVSSIAIFLILYLLSDLVLILLVPNILYKFILLLFASSPFIIGKIVTYKKLKFYSIIQILCVILGVGFVILI